MDEDKKRPEGAARPSGPNNFNSKTTLRLPLIIKSANSTIAEINLAAICFSSLYDYNSKRIIQGEELKNYIEGLNLDEMEVVING